MFGDDIVDTVLSWTAESDGGLNSLFNEINNGGLYSAGSDNGAPEGGALTEIYSYIDEQSEVAAQYGVQLLAYEGGQHLTTFGSTDTDDLSINDLFGLANRDVRMAQVYESLHEYWRDNGGGLFMSFESVSVNSIWGNFGNKEYQNQSQADAPKFEMLMNFIDENVCWWSNCTNN